MEFGYFTLSDNRYPTIRARPRISSGTSTPRRSGPRRSASTRHGSASIISIFSASMPRPRHPGAARRRDEQLRLAPPSRSCRCIIRCMSPRNGRPSTCCPAAESISPPAAATTARSTRPSGAVRRLGRAVRRGAGDRVARLDRDRQVVAQGQVLPLRGRRGAAAAGAEAASALCRLLLAAVDGARRKHDWNVIYAPFAAAMVYGSLADAVRVYRETCEAAFKRPMRAPCAPTSSTSPRRRRKSITARKRSCAISRTR